MSPAISGGTVVWSQASLGSGYDIYGGHVRPGGMFLKSVSWIVYGLIAVAFSFGLVRYLRMRRRRVRVGVQ